MDYTLNIFIGIASGIATSAIIYTALTLTKTVITPWLRKILYNGIDLSGRWYCADFSMAQEITIDLQQSANALKGTATFIKKTRENSHHFEDIRTFTITGKIKDRFVNLTLNNNDNKRLGVTNYLLEVVGDGCRLDGVLSFYGIHEHAITSSEQTLWRDKSQANNHYSQEEEIYYSRSSINDAHTFDDDHDTDEFLLDGSDAHPAESPHNVMSAISNAKEKHTEEQSSL